MLTRLTFSTLLFATLATGATAQAATYYVDRNLPGSDRNNGTSETTPFLTIQKCVNTVVAGDTCLIKNGTYAEAPLIVTSGVAGKPITFKNYPGHHPIINAAGTGANHAFMLNPDGVTPSTGISYVTVEGLEITGAPYEGIKCGNADHLIFRHNYVHHNSNTPITEPGSGIRCGGIYLTFDGNRFSYNGNISIAAYGHGMYLTGTNLVVINNIVDQNAGYGIQCAGYGFDPQRQPSAAYSGCQALIANNTIAYQRLKAGLVLWNPAVAPIATVKNNIFYENGQLTSGGAQGIVIYPGVSAVITNNVSYATLPGQTGFISADSIASCSSCTISGNSIDVSNPNMVNAPATVPASPDFHLTAGSSVAINFGLNLTDQGVTSDFFGIARPASGPWDVGAHEFSNDGTAPSPPQGLQVK